MNQSVTPYLCVGDAAAAIDFYAAVFGAKESGTRFVDQDGRIGHAELVFGDTVVYLSDEHPASGVAAPAPGALATCSLVLTVDDADGTVDRAIASGATLQQAVEEKFYGERSGKIVDPFGHRWMISSHVRDVSAEEMARVRDEYRGAVE